MKARWASIAYNVVFDANGGEGWKEPFEAICRYDETLTLPDETFVRAGYTLDGWDCGGTNYVCGAIVSNLTTEAGGRVTFAAQWKPVVYNVVFDGNGGTCETNSASVQLDGDGWRDSEDEGQLESWPQRFVGGAGY